MSSKQTYAFLFVISESTVDEIELDVREENRSIEIEEEYSDWDYDDVLPFSTFINSSGENVKWLNHSIANTLEEFSEEKTGPNISKDTNKPVDIFLTLFSEDLIKILVF